MSALSSVVPPNSTRFFSYVIIAFHLLLDLIAELICTCLKNSAYSIFDFFLISYRIIHW